MLPLFCCIISHKKVTSTFPYLSKLYYHVQFQDSKISVARVVLASQLRALRLKTDSGNLYGSHPDVLFYY